MAAVPLGDLAHYMIKALSHRGLPIAGPLDRYHKLQQLSLETHRFFMFEVCMRLMVPNATGMHAHCLRPKQHCMHMLHRHAGAPLLSLRVPGRSQFSNLEAARFRFSTAAFAGCNANPVQARAVLCTTAWRQTHRRLYSSHMSASLPRPPARAHHALVLNIGSLEAVHAY